LITLPVDYYIVNQCNIIGQFTVILFDLLHYQSIVTLDWCKMDSDSTFIYRFMNCEIMVTLYVGQSTSTMNQP